MDSKHTISISEARKRIFEIADDVQKPDTYYVLTENGKPKAVMLAYEQFDDLLDDLEIYSDPNLLKEIKEAEAEIARGEYSTWEEVKRELGLEPREDILALRDKGKQEYSVKRVSKRVSKKKKRGK